MRGDDAARLHRGSRAVRPLGCRGARTRDANRLHECAALSLAQGWLRLAAQARGEAPNCGFSAWGAGAASRGDHDSRQHAALHPSPTDRSSAALIATQILASRLAAQCSREAHQRRALATLGIRSRCATARVAARPRLTRLPRRLGTSKEVRQPRSLRPLRGVRSSCARPVLPLCTPPLRRNSQLRMCYLLRGRLRGLRGRTPLRTGRCSERRRAVQRGAVAGGRSERKLCAVAAAARLPLQRAKGQQSVCTPPNAGAHTQAAAATSGIGSGQARPS